MGFSPSTLAFPFIPRDVWNSMLFLPFPRSDFNYAVLFSFSFFKEEYPTCFPKLSPYLLLSLSLSLSCIILCTHAYQWTWVCTECVEKCWVLLSSDKKYGWRKTLKLNERKTEVLLCGSSSRRESIPATAFQLVKRPFRSPKWWKPLE